MIRLFIILICIGLAILIVPDQWKKEGRKFIEQHLKQVEPSLLQESDKIKSPVLREKAKFKESIEDIKNTKDIPSSGAEILPKSQTEPALLVHKDDEAELDELLEVQEKILHALRMLEDDDDK